MTKKKKIIIIVVTIVIIGLTIGGIFLGRYLKSVSDYQKKVDNTVVANVDISKLSDGIYVGEYDVDFIYVKVEVIIISGAINKIDLIKHDNDRGSTAESIINNVIVNQSLEVDTITGATNSSKVILKAIENALKSTPKPLI